MIDARRIERVVLTSKHPDATYTQVFVNDWDTGEYIDEYQFPTHYWSVDVEYVESEEFNKIEEILERRFAGAKNYHGGEVTAEILEALGIG